MSGAATTSTQALGRFVAATSCTDLAPALRHEGRRSLLNFLGCALAVIRAPAVEQALAVVTACSGPPEATVIGRHRRLDAMGAAFVNAIAGNLLDYDDTHLETVIHPTAPVAPPALALAERTGAGGAAMLTAFALGAEVECRIGKAVSPGHYDRGWHITSTCGIFGAAAAAAKLLGLDGTRTAHALGIAAGQSAGLVENLASAAKNVSVGSAARNGIFAALLAARGYQAAPTAIEGPLGWAAATGDEADLAAMTGALGERWEFSRNTYKPYPCGIVLHAVIDACLELRAAGGLIPGDVKQVIVRGDALLLARGDRPVHDERDARVSIHHCVAVALAHGAAGVAEFTPERVRDPALAELRAKVSAERDDSMPRGAAAVSVITRRGERREATVHHARGSVQQPLTDAAIENKVRECAAGTGIDAAAVIDAVWSLDTAPSTAALTRLLAPA